MERSKDSEKSQRIISFHWREEAMLKRRLSSLESMKRQVELSFCLDQRILCSRFQTKLRRSAQAWARVVQDDEELIWRLADENFPFDIAPASDAGRSVSQLGGIPEGGHRSGSPGQRAATVPGGDRSRSVCGPRRTVLSRNAQSKPPQQDGGVPPQRTRSQSSQPSFRRITFPSSQRPASSALPPQQRAVKPRPITAAAALQDTKGQPQPTAEEFREGGGEAVKDDRQAPPAAKTFSEQPIKRVQDLGPKHEPLDVPAAPIAVREEAEEDRGEEKPSGATGEPELSVKVSRFVEKVKNMKHQGCIMTDYYSHKLDEGLSGRKEVPPVTEEPGGWSLVGSEKASRSITMQALDAVRPAEDPPAELLVLESYGALLTRENQEERNWVDNDPYGSADPRPHTTTAPVPVTGGDSRVSRSQHTHQVVTLY